MQYTYSETYGKHEHLSSAAIKRLHDNGLQTQQEYDALVDKGLLQCMKEDKMHFARLRKVLQAETAKAQHSQDRWRVPAWQMLDKYTGPCYALPEESDSSLALRYYWYDHLSVARALHPTAQEPQKSSTDSAL